MSKQELVEDAPKLLPKIEGILKKILGVGTVGAAGGAGYLLSNVLGAGIGSGQASGIAAPGGGGAGGGGAGGMVPGGSYSPPASSTDIANQAMKISNPTLVTISTQLDKLLNLTAKTNAGIGDMSSLTRYNMDRQAKMERETRLESPAQPQGAPGPTSRGQTGESGGGLGSIAKLVGAGVAAGLALYFGKQALDGQDSGQPGGRSTPDGRPAPPPPPLTAPPSPDRPEDKDKGAWDIIKEGVGSAWEGIKNAPGDLYDAGKAVTDAVGVTTPDAAPASQQQQSPSTTPAEPGSLRSPVSPGNIIVSPMGPRGSRNHKGLDIGVPSGTSVKAAGDGTVCFAGTTKSGSWGNIIVVYHGGSKQLATLYAHLSKFKVARGAKVTRGQEIALSGSTGRSSGPHLHFEVREGYDPKKSPVPGNGTSVDPGSHGVSGMPSHPRRGDKTAVNDATPTSPNEQLANAAPAPGPVQSPGGMQLASFSPPVGSSDRTWMNAPPGHDPNDFSDVVALNNSTPIDDGYDPDPTHYENLGPSGFPTEASRLKFEYTKVGRNIQSTQQPTQGMLMLAALPAAAPAPNVVPSNPNVKPFTPPTPGGGPVTVPKALNDNEVKNLIKEIWKRDGNPASTFKKIIAFLKKIKVPRNKWVFLIAGGLGLLSFNPKVVEGWIREFLPDEVPEEIQPQPAQPQPQQPVSPAIQPGQDPNAEPAAEPVKPAAGAEPVKPAAGAEPVKPVPPIVRPTPFFVPPKKERDKYKGGGDWRFRQIGRGEVAGLTFKLREIDKNPGVALGASRGSGRLGLGMEMPLRGIIANRLPDLRKPFEDYDQVSEEDGRISSSSTPTTFNEEMPTKPTKSMPEPFWKAFKAARERAKGPKGWFTWNGKKYQTNYKNEPYLPISKLTNVDVPVANKETPTTDQTNGVTPKQDATQQAAEKPTSTVPASTSSTAVSQPANAALVEQSEEVDPEGNWKKLADGRIVDPDFPDDPDANNNAMAAYKLSHKDKSKAQLASTPTATPVQPQATTEPPTNPAPVDEGSQSSPQRPAAKQVQAEDIKTAAVVNLSKKPPPVINGNSPANPAAQMRAKRMQQQNSPPPSAAGGRGATQSEVPEPGAGERLKEYQLYFNSYHAIETTF